MRRARPKKKGGIIDAGKAEDLLNVLNSNGGIDEKQLLEILKVEKRPCDHLKAPCKTNRKENVACFCQLVPPETSFRKKGLWVKDQSYLASLGADPSDTKRQEPSHPAGLRNLGNTCYANAALQCLYGIPSLRNGIYCAEPQVASHAIFRALQRLFLGMQFGPHASVDTEDLAKTLGLDHGVQQDGQEFLKLLLTRVEQLMSSSKDQDAKFLVQRLFRGGLSYVTTCQRCGRDSTSSANVQDFYDLMPQVRGFESLRDSLACLLHAESLSGDNQYRCDFCAAKVDALRRVRLRSLPPYLCLALQRFYFNPNTGDKAKALDKFSFPLQLDFTDVLAAAAAADEAPEGQPRSEAKPPGDVTEGAAAGEAGAEGAAGGVNGKAEGDGKSGETEPPTYPTGSPLYELVAILIHKGGQAHSGHYVAHIKDQRSGQWWRFDDETAECMGDQPTGFHGDHGAAAAAVAAEGNKGSGASRKRASRKADGDDDPEYESNDAEATEQVAQDELDEQDEQQPQPKGRGRGRGRGKGAGQRGGKRGGSAGRGAKRAASGAAKGKAAKRGKGAAAAMEDDDDEDMQMAKALSLQPQPQQQQQGGGDVDMGGDSDRELRAAMRASLQEERDMAQAMEMSRRGAEVPNGDGDAAARVATRQAVAQAAAVPLPKEEHASQGQEPAPQERPPAPQEGETVAKPEVEEKEDATIKAGESVAPDANGTSADLEKPTADAQAAAEAPKAAPVRSLVSSNAYMLVYRAVGYGEAAALSEVGALPAELQAVVSEQAAAFMDTCDTYERQSKAMEAQVEARRSAVRSILPILPAGSAAAAAAPAPTPAAAGNPAGPDGPSAEAVVQEAGAAGDGEPSKDALDGGPTGYWVAMEWLDQWINEQGPAPAIDNSSIVCTKHARSSGAEQRPGSGESCTRLDPRKATSAKLVSAEAWRRLQESHGGGPALAATDVCLECLEGSFSTALLGSRADQVRARVAAMLGDKGAGDDEDAEADDEGLQADSDDECTLMEAGRAAGLANARYWVSRMWLQGWVKRQGTSVQVEKSPTQELACPHGQLMPAVAGKTARRIAVPGDVWALVRDLWRTERTRLAQEGPKAGRGGAAKGRGGKRGQAAAEAVESVDLTDDSGPAAGCGKESNGNAAAGSSKVAEKRKAESNGEEIDLVDDDDDDDVVMVEPAEAAGQQQQEGQAPATGGEGSAREASAVPSSREATVEPPAPAAAAATPPPAGKGPSAASPPHEEQQQQQGRVPTQAELDAQCPVFRVGACRECRQCAQTAGWHADEAAGTRRQATAEKTALANLAEDAILPLDLKQTYFLVPGGWLSDWQSFVRSSGKRTAGPATAAAAPGGSAAGSVAAGRPGSLPHAMLPLLCSCHREEPRLGVPLPQLIIKKRGRVVQAQPQSDALRLVEKDEWAKLCQLYGPAAATTAKRGTPCRPKRRAAGASSAEAAAAAAPASAVDVDNVVMVEGEQWPGGSLGTAGGTGGEGTPAGQQENGIGPSCAEVPLEETPAWAAVVEGFKAELVLHEAGPGAGAAGQEQAGQEGGGSRGAGADGEAGPGKSGQGQPQPQPQPMLVTWPRVCAEALARSDRAAREALLSYTCAEVFVELVAAEELETSLREAANSERKSKRSRKGRATLVVTNTSTLAQFKLQVWEALSIHPKNQRLYVRGDGGCPRELQGDELSLAQHEVLPGQELRLVRGAGGDDNDDDVAGLLGEGGASKRRQVEEGFKNTALHGDIPPGGYSSASGAAGAATAGAQVQAEASPDA